MVKYAYQDVRSLLEIGDQVSNRYDPWTSQTLATHDCSQVSPLGLDLHVTGEVKTNSVQ